MIHSNRLICCEPVQEDFERFYEIHTDPETNLFNPNGAMSFEMAEKAFASITAHWKEQGFGPWSIREKDAPEYIIGFGGLDYRLYGSEEKLNLGYRFDKKYWGKGYATELAESAIVFGFNEINKPEIFAIVRPKHLASIKVLEKCNMRPVGDLNDVPNTENSLLYKIER